MVHRVYGLGFDGDPVRVISQIESTASATARSALQVELHIDLGASVGSAEYLYLKQNRALVLSQLREILNELESGRQPWPPALT